MYRFVNPDDLELRDYICFGISVVLILIYHLYLFLYSYYYPHSSLESHMDYQRLWWVRQVYDDVREKISTIQNFRSTMMIMGFYTKITLVGAAASVELAVETPGFFAKARGFFPAILFIVSFGNLVIGAFSLFYLHWHCTLEVTVNSAAGAGAVIADAEQNSGAITEREMKTSKLHIAAMLVQFKIHFRMTQRFMLAALASMLWNVEPIMMLCCYIIMVLNFYYCDFPFPEEVSQLFTTSKGADRGDRGRTQFTATHDRVRGVIRPKTQTMKSALSLYRGTGMTPERSGSMHQTPRLSGQSQGLIPYQPGGGGSGREGSAGAVHSGSPFLAATNNKSSTSSQRKSDASTGSGPRPTFHIPHVEEVNNDEGSSTSSPTFGRGQQGGLQRGESGESQDDVRTSPHRTAADSAAATAGAGPSGGFHEQPLPPLVISHMDEGGSNHNINNHRNSLVRGEEGTEMQSHLLGDGHGRNPVAISPGTSQFSSPTPDVDARSNADPNGRSHASVVTVGEVAQAAGTPPGHNSVDPDKEQPAPIVVTSDTEDDDEEDFLAMQ